MMDERLIGEVQKHAIIYNRQKNNMINGDKCASKELSWVEIARNLGTDVDSCKKRWKYLRERYVQQRKVGDSPCYEHLSRPYLEKMKFLDHFIQPRKSYRNVLSPNDLHSMGSGGSGGSSGIGYGANGLMIGYDGNDSSNSNCSLPMAATAAVLLSQSYQNDFNLGNDVGGGPLDNSNNMNALTEEAYNKLFQHSNDSTSVHHQQQQQQQQQNAFQSQESHQQHNNFFIPNSTSSSNSSSNNNNNNNTRNQQQFSHQNNHIKKYKEERMENANSLNESNQSRSSSSSPEILKNETELHIIHSSSSELSSSSSSSSITSNEASPLVIHNNNNNNNNSTSNNTINNNNKRKRTISNSNNNNLNHSFSSTSTSTTMPSSSAPEQKYNNKINNNYNNSSNHNNNNTLGNSSDLDQPSSPIDDNSPKYSNDFLYPYYHHHRQLEQNQSQQQPQPHQQQPQSQSQSVHRNSEQLIGEMVTSELLKMTKERRKIVQKKILQILFFED